MIGATSWGLTLQGTTSKKMWDDGTNGDAISNDSIYSVQFTYTADDPIGQETCLGSVFMIIHVFA